MKEKGFDFFFNNWVNKTNIVFSRYESVFYSPSLF